MEKWQKNINLDLERNLDGIPDVSKVDEKVLNLNRRPNNIIQNKKKLILDSNIDSKSLNCLFSNINGEKSLELNDFLKLNNFFLNARIIETLIISFGLSTHGKSHFIINAYKIQKKKEDILFFKLPNTKNWDNSDFKKFSFGIMELPERIIQFDKIIVLLDKYSDNFYTLVKDLLFVGFSILNDHYEKDHSKFLIMQFHFLSHPPFKKMISDPISTSSLQMIKN